MAAKERADLLRSARRKILQNSVFRQRRTNRNRILQKFLSSLTPSGVGRKSRQSSTKSASMGTGRVEPEEMRALASRLAASPPVLRRARGCAFANRFARHCPRRPSRTTTPRGCSGLPPSSQAPRRSPARAGTGLSCAVGPVRRVPDGGFEINVIFDVGPGSPRRAAKTARRRFLRTTPACPSGLGPRGPASARAAECRDDHRDRLSRAIWPPVAAKHKAHRTDG